MSFEMDCSDLEDSKCENISVCRLCLEDSACLYPVIYLEKCLYSVLPNLDLTLSKDPELCENCTETLTQCYNFQIQCLTNQERILQHKTSSEPVDLNNLGNRATVNEGETCEAETEKSHAFFGRNFTGIVAKLLRPSEGCKNYLKKIEEPETEIISSLGVKLNNSIASLFSDETDMASDMAFVDENGHRIKTEISQREDDICNEKSDSSTIFQGVVEEVVFGYNNHVEAENANNIEDFKQSSNKSFRVYQEYPMQNKDFTSSDKYNNMMPRPNKIWKRTDSQNFQCLLCKKKFVQRIHLDGHLLNKHKDIPNIDLVVVSKLHYCQYCTYRTINSYNLTSHLMSKHGKTRKGNYQLKKYSCSYCSYETHNPGNIAAHLRTHENAKPYKCTYCIKSYRQKHNLECHYRKCHPEDFNEN